MKTRADLTAQLSELSALIKRLTPGDGTHATPLPQVSLLRQSVPTGEPLHGVHEPAMCLVVQGAKQVSLNGEVYSYDASRHLVVSVDLPICGQVTQATVDEPYLCFRLDLQPAQIAALILETDVPASADRGGVRALAVVQTSPQLLDAVLRLMRLLEAPEDIRTLAPLATREILYRLLKSDHGHLLRQIATTDGQTQRVARAISWLKKHFDQPLRIEEVARDLNMSVSSLHHHFKAVTAMSPLQYQKQLRLQEARRLMLVQDVDAATAGHRVGYESPSQFGREYSRHFGAPPARDLRRLREQPSG
ncbi:MAG: AraC family transcriptional regulator [Gammaproteobacteria bacterium]